MTEIVIVTAFFSIGREKWSGFQKTDEEYFGYFSFWARLKNKLIVYVSNEKQAETIMEIREGYGLRDRTVCVVMEDIFSVDPTLYQSIERVSKYEGIRDYRLYRENPESWNPDYNYIMLMKEWCVKDAIEHGLAEGMIAWVDFGINKGGAVYPKEEEFDFLWAYDFPEKINLFTLGDIEDRPPIYEMIRDMSTIIQGGIIVAPAELWKELWALMRKNMLFLNKIGLMDDDQTLLLMAYLDNKELFFLHRCDWILQFKNFGKKDLTVREMKGKPLSLLKKAYIWLRRFVFGRYPEINSYLKAQKKSILSNKEKGYR